jgi:hypothetical protein
LGRSLGGTLFLLLFALSDAVADDLEQFFLFLLEVFLALGAARFRGRGVAGDRRDSAASAALSTAAAESTAPAATRRGRRTSGGCGSAADVGELHEKTAIQRHHEEVAVACERNALTVLREAGIGFGVGGLSQLGDLAGSVVQGK